MKIRGIDFGNVFNSSGALGFYGEGWWFHKIWQLLFTGFRPDLLTFKSKTATWLARDGNMTKKKGAWFRNLFPACVVIKFWQQAVLNAVGLTNDGIPALLSRGIWQKLREPFIISVMAVADTKEMRLKEMRNIIEEIKRRLLDLDMAVDIKVTLEINISCPNTKHNTAELAKEALDLLRIAKTLNIPIFLKVNVFASTDFIKEIEASGLCDAIVCTNTLPWGSFPTLIPWEKIFGDKVSPLEKRDFGKDAGGLSGPWLFPFLVDWVYRIRQAGITIPIVVGGGIIRKQDILLLKLAGANAIEMGVGYFIFRPWAMKSAVRYATMIFGNKPQNSGDKT